MGGGEEVEHGLRAQGWLCWAVRFRKSTALPVARHPLQCPLSIRKERVRDSGGEHPRPPDGPLRHPVALKGTPLPTRLLSFHVK